jgi:hypothetical protein
MEDDWKIFAARMEAILPTLATKADMESLRADVARWTLATVIGLFIGFGGLFVAMSNILKPAAAPPPCNCSAPAVQAAAPVPQAQPLPQRTQQK